MGFLVSPGVEVNEIDLTNVIPAVSTSVGGYSGEFSWGPVGVPVLISSEKELTSTFGPPNASNQESYLNCAAFLKYTNALRVVRAAPTPDENNQGGTVNAAQLRTSQFVPGPGSDGIPRYDADIFDNADDPDVIAYVPNKDSFDALSLPLSGDNLVRPIDDSESESDFNAKGWDWAARYPGALGNSLSVSYQVGGSTQDLPGLAAGTFAKPTTTQWAQDNISATVNDEVHIVIFDEDGLITGTKGTILEQWVGLSMLKDAKKPDGSTNFFADIINRDSEWIYIGTPSHFINSHNRSGITSDTGDGAGTATFYLPGALSTSVSITANKKFVINDSITGKTLDFAGSLSGTYAASTDSDSGLPFTKPSWWDSYDVNAPNLAVYSDTANAYLTFGIDGSNSTLLDGISINETFPVDALEDTTLSSVDHYYIQYVNCNIAAGDSNYIFDAMAGGVKVLNSDIISNTSTISSTSDLATTQVLYQLGGLTDISFTGQNNKHILVSASVHTDNNGVILIDTNGSAGLALGGIQLNGLSGSSSAAGAAIHLRFARLVKLTPADISLTVSASASETLSLAGGSDADISSSALTTGLDKLKDSETIDISLLFAQRHPGSSETTVPNKIVEVCDHRKDCVGFISPPLERSVVTGAADSRSVEHYFNTTLNINSNYVVLDSSPVQVYNKYNDTYQFIQAAPHIAGLCARTDDTNDAWFSPAGYNRGQLLGVSKLKFNPTQAQRDDLYLARINPIVSFPGQGIILFGDKTSQAKPSAFDRINVRRLFIVLEKAIATAAKYQLFELNDEFTRAMFRNMVEPFLRDVKGRRGITDFLVVCDETNNTGQVIDSNRFVADIYVKPARSINFITLNFIATRTGVEFTEIAGGQG